MFVKKLVEMAAKKPGACLESLKPEDIAPRVAFHCGIPSEATLLAYDPLQNILAISTKKGQIKLLGKDNTQALLESNDMQPSKFLQFIPNQGILLNVTFKDKIEVWDIDRKALCHVHEFEEEITSLAIVEQCFFIYIGDSVGNVTVWRLDQESFHLQKMNYFIPFSASHGNTNEDTVSCPVMNILPQPSAESMRILLIFADGLMVLWALQESNTIFVTGKFTAQQLLHEAKKTTSACWVCPLGSKVAVGYNTGDILLFSIPSNSNAGSSSSNSGNSLNPQNFHISKINLEYKLERVSVASLKWVYSDAKANRLYVVGTSDATLPNMVQVILLNEDTENRIIRLGLQLPEPCIDIEIISCSNKLAKHKQGFLLLLGKSGHMYAFDDHAIEKYLQQSQTKSSASVPSELNIKLLYASRTTSAVFLTNCSNCSSSGDEEYMAVAKSYPYFLPSEAKHYDRPPFTGFAQIKNLYITGHVDGTIKFWDVAGSLFVPLLSLTQQFILHLQSEDDSSQSNGEVTAIYFCTESRILFSGDKSGMVCIHQFKPEPFATENSFFSLAGNSKKGNDQVIHSVKHIKVDGPVLCLKITSGSRHLAVGCEQGHISLIDVEGPSVLYHKQIETELCADIISLQFACSDFHGFKKNVLMVATRDSSLLALDEDTGNTLSSGTVHPKKPSRALLMQILDTSKVALTEDTTRKAQLLLLCSEKAAYIYSFPHAVQGEKKVYYKRSFHNSSCCWATVVYRASSIGVIFVFSCGRTEIRSLPELALVKEATLRSFTHLSAKLNSYPDYFCSSADGEFIVTRSDQEIVVASVFLQNETYRHVDFLSQVYDKSSLSLEDGPTSIRQKEKRKGIFGTVFKDATVSKTNNGAGGQTATKEEMSTIFSVSNFPVLAKDADNSSLEVDDIDLDIDDIYLSHQDGNPKGQNMMVMLNKQKLVTKFQSLKGKLKQMTVKNEKPSVQEGPPNEKAEVVDEIKKRYGYPSSNESSLASLVERRLSDNVKKLQGISSKTADMQDSASSFSSLAKETLHTAEQKHKPVQI